MSAPPRSAGSKAAASWAPDRGEVIWIDHNPQAGQEMRDVHPLLVLSSKAFNERTGIVVGLPMTSAASNETNPFAIGLDDPAGVRRYVLTHQPKSFDWRARGARPHKWGRVPAGRLREALDSLGQILGLSP